MKNCGVINFAVVVGSREGEMCTSMHKVPDGRIFVLSSLEEECELVSSSYSLCMSLLDY